MRTGQWTWTERTAVVVGKFEEEKERGEKTRWGEGLIKEVSERGTLGSEQHSWCLTRPFLFFFFFPPKTSFVGLSNFLPLLPGGLGVLT